MQRREMIRLLGSLGATSALASLPGEQLWAVGLDAHRRAPGRALRVLSREAAEAIARIADLVLPRTDTPGALDVGCVELIDLLLAEWFTPADRDLLLKGLAAIDTTAAALPATARAIEAQTRGPKGTPSGTWWELKYLTLFAWFTSERVTKDVLKYQIWPGRYGGCEDMTLPAHGARPA